MGSLLAVTHAAAAGGGIRAGVPALAVADTGALITGDGVTLGLGGGLPGTVPETLITGTPSGPEGVQHREEN